MARPIRPGSGAFIALIAALMAMTAMTIDINLPAIPVTAEALGASLTTTQLTVTIFFGGFAVGQLVWGPLSDRIGRKPGVLVGTAVYVVATVGCALAPSIEALLALRAVQGFGAGAGSVLSRAIIRDLFEGPQMARILSLALAAFITAPIVAPSIGAVILGFASWRWIFGFLAI
jgi:MFS transporter, DHA1 family, multidrug resistance protein